MKTENILQAESVTQLLENKADKRLPGDLAMWFFILAELTVFAVFFIGFAVAENANMAMFAEGKAQLHKVAGLINTIALITSSYFVALSLHSMRKNNAKQTLRHLGLALVFAGVYVVLKLWEYQALFALGIHIETNTFFTLYFLITAFHFLHIILGMLILAYMAINVYKDNYNDPTTENEFSGFESGACYWHMVDLLWIILFPLIYII
ncbi:nitric oxide reductase NorE protein [Colwellia chukchiensis]|uniref:Nitric oxide reductase NorE protein n=1 Tax=Colwellia chukchiensis TaxID=641665 RepID=A0A1H7KNK2_9GAMM|nr:cytochrome c oxidase subunit 3 family protein [Colwellia chukchiensis]SEK88443.1 nitric oxide reductase NorE protein [Colwellia chukchiensis]